MVWLENVVFGGRIAQVCTGLAFLPLLDCLHLPQMSFGTIAFFICIVTVTAPEQNGNGYLMMAAILCSFSIFIFGLLGLFAILIPGCIVWYIVLLIDAGAVCYSIAAGIVRRRRVHFEGVQSWMLTCFNTVRPEESVIHQVALSRLVPHNFRLRFHEHCTDRHVRSGERGPLVSVGDACGSRGPKDSAFSTCRK